MRAGKLTTAIVLVLLAVSTGCGSSRHAAGQKPASTASSGPSSTTGPATAGPATTYPAKTGAIVSGNPGCSNDTATASVLAALAGADGRPTVTELPGYTFYGNCGGSRYAVAALVAGPLATPSETVAFGSGAATAEFFTEAGDSPWTVTARSTAGSYSCAPFNIPTGLRASWGDCQVPLHPEPPGPPAEGDQAACLEQTGSRTYVRLTDVQVAGDGAATLQGVPQGVHCGGPDDFQYANSGPSETLHLLPGAPVGIFNITAGTETSQPVGGLAAYLQHPELGIFQVYGSPPNLVTGVAEQFHP